MGNSISSSNAKKAFTRKNNLSASLEGTATPNHQNLKLPDSADASESQNADDYIPNLDISEDIVSLEISNAPKKSAAPLKKQQRKETLAERRSVGSSSPRKPKLAAIKSNPEDLAKISRKHLPRSLTNSKPPRLDTSKIALLATKNSPQFSPLSANASDRAKTFLDLALVLYNENFLHPIYSGWVLGQSVASIRNSCRALFERLKQLEQARLEEEGIDFCVNNEENGNQTSKNMETSMGGQLLNSSATKIPKTKLSRKDLVQNNYIYSREIAYNSKNSALNRYADIAPFDRNRVVLSTKSKDYINASHMKSMDGQKEYIATQGPLKSTLGDFWQMTWEQNSAVIVMLTRTEESSRLKSHKYWPENVGDTKRYHKSVGNNSICFKVFYADEIQMMDKTTIIRELIVKREMFLKDDDKEEEIRLIRIIHYLSWSDYDSCDARSLLSLIDIVNEVNRQANQDIVNRRDIHYSHKIGPMVINCSAGVGRTGTFCVADSVLAMLVNPQPLLPDVDKGDWDQFPPQDLIAQTVNHFRTQRCGFVQTSAQFELLYDAILLKIGDLYTAKFKATWPTLNNCIS